MRAEPLFLVCALVVISTCAAKRGHCQVNTLVHVAVSEARWSSPADESAMWHVLQRYSWKHRVSLPTAAKPLVWDHSSPPSWVRRLTPRCERPAGFPAHRRWLPLVGDCRALYARARAFLRGDVADPCMYRAAGWRAPGKALRRALRRGWVVAECGSTLNVFVREA